jgi:hypothetical protein
MLQETTCSCLNVDNNYLKSRVLTNLNRLNTTSLIYDELSEDEVLYAVSIVNRLNLPHIIYHFLLTSNNNIVSSRNNNSISIDTNNLFDIVFGNQYGLDNYELSNSALLSEFLGNINSLYEALDIMVDKNLDILIRENLKNIVIDLVLLILEALLIELFGRVPDFTNQIYVFLNSLDNSLSFIIIA